MRRFEPQVDPRGLFAASKTDEWSKDSEWRVVDAKTGNPVCGHTLDSLASITAYVKQSSFVPGSRPCPSCEGEEEEEERKPVELARVESSSSLASIDALLDSMQEEEEEEESKTDSEQEMAPVESHSRLSERAMEDYGGFSFPPDPISGHAPMLDIYKAYVPGWKVEEGTIRLVWDGFAHISPGGAKEVVEDQANNTFHLRPRSHDDQKVTIAYTKMNGVTRTGPLVLFLHGVPTNRRQWYPVQRMVSWFCDTISIDMLGMGESEKLIIKDRKESHKAWAWQNDVSYIHDLVRKLYPERKGKFVAVTDDWGGGIFFAYAAAHPEDLLAQIYLDPIALDGYPVSEIQTFGRTSDMPKKAFIAAMGASDQTLVQIFKTMVYDPNKFNQYNLRDIKFPYVDVDYERPGGADSTTLRLKYGALRVLAQRAAILSPSLLLPWHPSLNPGGIPYHKVVDVPTLVMWGEYDNMMPAQQRQRLFYVYRNLGIGRYQSTEVPRAGHFAAEDQPEKVAGVLVEFIRNHLGEEALAGPFLGFDGIWKGDEEEFVRFLQRTWAHAS